MEIVADVFAKIEEIFNIVINFIKGLFNSIKPEDEETTAQA